MTIIPVMNPEFYASDPARVTRSITMLKSVMGNDVWLEVTPMIPEHRPNDAVLLCFVDLETRLEAFVAELDAETRGRIVVMDLFADDLLEIVERFGLLAVAGFGVVTKWHMALLSQFFKLGIDYGFYGRTEFSGSADLLIIDVEQFASAHYQLMHVAERSNLGQALAIYLRLVEQGSEKSFAAGEFAASAPMTELM